MCNTLSPFCVLFPRPSPNYYQKALFFRGLCKSNLLVCYGVCLEFSWELWHYFLITSLHSIAYTFITYDPYPLSEWLLLLIQFHNIRGGHFCYMVFYKEKWGSLNLFLAFFPFPTTLLSTPNFPPPTLTQQEIYIRHRGEWIALYHKF